MKLLGRIFIGALALIFGTLLFVLTCFFPMQAIALVAVIWVFSR